MKRFPSARYLDITYSLGKKGGILAQCYLLLESSQVNSCFKLENRIEKNELTARRYCDNKNPKTTGNPKLDTDVGFFSQTHFNSSVVLLLFVFAVLLLFSSTDSVNCFVETIELRCICFHSGLYLESCCKIV